MTTPAAKAPAKRAAAKAVAAKPEPPVQNVDTSDERGPEVDVPGMLAMTQEEWNKAHPLNIQDAILEVMKVVGAIGKSELNTTPGANYNFRGVDTVVNAVAPAFLMFGVTISPRCLHANSSRSPKDTNQGKVQLWADVLMEYTLTARDGSERKWTAPGAAQDSGDKAIGKACSVAYRIAMLQGLCIPTHEPDPDLYQPDPDEGYQTHGSGQNASERGSQRQERPNQNDYTAPRQPSPADTVREYTLRVMSEFEHTDGKRWTGQDIRNKFHDLYKKDYLVEDNLELLKEFGKDLRDTAIQDRAIEEERATQNVLDGLGGKVIETPEGEADPNVNGE